MKMNLNTPAPLDPSLAERLRAVPGAALLTVGYLISAVLPRPRR